MNEIRKVNEIHHGAASAAELVMFSDVRLIEAYETEGHLLPKGKVGGLVERFSDEHVGVDFDDLRTFLVIPTRLLVPA